jgi:hypothetical protein
VCHLVSEYREAIHSHQGLVFAVDLLVCNKTGRAIEVLY